MSPELFIKKHITDALLGEGFSELVAQGRGLISGWITTGAALSPVGRGACMKIVCSTPASGRWGRQRKQNDGQRKSREEGPTRPVPIHALNSLEG